MTEPRTEAGKALLCLLPGPDEWGNGIAWEQRVASIEAEATHATLAAVRELVTRRLDNVDRGPLRTVLDILDDLENADRVPVPLNRKVNG